MRNKSNVPKIKPSYAFVVEGETEKQYLLMLQRNESSIKSTIKPELTPKKKIKEQYYQVIELSKAHKKVFWIIDFDKLFEESKEAKHKQNTQLQKFKEYKNEIEKVINSNIVIIINQPCIEFWFLLHFKNTAPNFSKCKKAEDLLNKYISDYTKNQKYFTKQDNDIYLKLKPNLKTAMQNSQSISSNGFDFTDKGYSDMYKIFKEFDL